MNLLRTIMDFYIMTTIKGMIYCSFESMHTSQEEATQWFVFHTINILSVGSVYINSLGYTTYMVLQNDKLAHGDIIMIYIIIYLL